MKILYVHGEGDYSALTFENDLEGDTAKYWDLANAESNKTYVDEKAGIEFDAYEFGDVDPKFIDFIRDGVQDYDASKHSNFYVVKANES